LDLLVLQGLLVVGWCTLDGGEPLVQIPLEHSSCMEVELLEAIIPTREGELTTAAYLTIQAIYSTHLAISQTVNIYMEQNMRQAKTVHSCRLITTTFHVRCAMSQQGKQCSWYLHGPHAPLPGLKSTMATWCLNATHTIAQCMNASIKTLNQYLEVLEIRVRLYSTMWKQHVGGLPALRTQLGKN